MKERIRQIQDREGMSQKDFAAAIGISQASLSSIYNGRTLPTNRHVEATGNMDWSAAEHMIEYEDYRCGFVVDYNTEAAYNAGSAIFFRIGSRSTAGGIAASQRDVEGFLRRLDKRKTPYILIV